MHGNLRGDCFLKYPDKGSHFFKKLISRRTYFGKRATYVVREEEKALLAVDVTVLTDLEWKSWFSERTPNSILFSVVFYAIAWPGRASEWKFCCVFDKEEIHPPQLRQQEEFGILRC